MLKKYKNFLTIFIFLEKDKEIKDVRRIFNLYV